MTLEREADRFGTVRYVEPHEYVAELFLDCDQGDVQLVCNLLVREASRCQFELLQLPIRETGGVGLFIHQRLNLF